MKKQTVRLILDCMICDAMSPEFKKANDILLRIVKTNDRTGGIEYTRLAEMNKAFKANDAKAARIAYDKLASNIAKGEKRLQDELNEAKSKLAETSRAFEEAKSALAQQKPLAAMFDKFVKAIDAAKTNHKGVSKLNAYADKLKAFGDFSKRIMQIQQMATAKKDIAKQCDMLKKTVEAGKAKHAKAMKKAEDDLAKAKDRVSVFKEMDKIRTKKIAEFAKEREDVQKLGQALPAESVSAASGKSGTASGKASTASGKASTASGKASTASGKANTESGKTSAASKKAHTDKCLSLLKKKLEQENPINYVRVELKGDTIYAVVSMTVKGYGDDALSYLYEEPSTDKVSYSVSVRKGYTELRAKNKDPFFPDEWNYLKINYEFTGIKSVEVTYLVYHD